MGICYTCIVNSSQVKILIGSNIQMFIAKHSDGIFKHITYTKRRKVCIENMVIILQTNCTTKIKGILLIALTSITSFTYYIYTTS